MGPASNTEERLEALIQAGMNVARLNFSHGEHAIHGQTIANVRKVDEKLGTHTALLADLQGPKLRIGELEGGQIDLVKGEELVIRTGKETGTAGIVYTSYMQFARDVKAGEPVLMDDGKLELRVLETDGKGKVRCEVVHGGVLKPRKGINLPSTAISLPCITEKDAVDLAYALEQDVDWIGLSFVRNAQDIVELRERIEAEGKHTRIIAKIEKPEALEDLEGILEETDAVMIARGDLGWRSPSRKCHWSRRTSSSAACTWASR